jgi:Mce-associated membrane protein
MTQPNEATLDDVRADPAPDEEADDTTSGGPGGLDAGVAASARPPGDLDAAASPRQPGGLDADWAASPRPPAPAPAPSSPAPVPPMAPGPKAKKKPKRQELQAQIQQLEAQVRGLEAEPGTAPPDGRTPWVVPIVAGAVIVALAVGLVLTGLRLRQADTTSSARTSAVAAAAAYAVDLSSYDYRHLSHDFGIVTAHSTPSFARTFIQQSDALKPVLTKYKATAKATVGAVGLTSGSASRAVVLVLVSQTVSNSVQKKGPTTDRSQVSLTLVRQHGHWLIENAQLL